MSAKKDRKKDEQMQRQQERDLDRVNLNHEDEDMDTGEQMRSQRTDESAARAQRAGQGNK